MHFVASNKTVEHKRNFLILLFLFLLENEPGHQSSQSCRKEHSLRVHENVSSLKLPTSYKLRILTHNIDMQFSLSLSLSISNLVLSISQFGIMSKHLVDTSFNEFPNQTIKYLVSECIVVNYRFIFCINQLPLYQSSHPLALTLKVRLVQNLTNRLHDYLVPQTQSSYQPGLQFNHLHDSLIKLEYNQWFGLLIQLVCYILFSTWCAISLCIRCCSN